jgi:hypothetical protein
MTKIKSHGISCRATSGGFTVQVPRTLEDEAIAATLGSGASPSTAEHGGLSAWATVEGPRWQVSATQIIDYQAAITDHERCAEVM